MILSWMVVKFRFVWIKGHQDEEEEDSISTNLICVN